MEIIRNDNMDIPRIVQKWAPVLENLFNRDTAKGMDYYTEDQISEIARYCEYHIISESNFYGQVTNVNLNPVAGPEDISTLPLALNLISKLNLKGKRFIAVSGPRSEFMEITAEGPRVKDVMVGTMESTSVLNRDLMLANGGEEHYEHFLIEDMAQQMNTRLKYTDTIVMYLGAQSMSVISEATFAPRILLRSRAAFIEKNDERESIYQLERNSNGVVTKIELLDIDSDEYTKTVSEDGKVFWVNLTDNVILENTYSESEVIGIINEYKKVIQDSETSLSRLRDVIYTEE